MRPRVALATYERAPGLAPDDRLLLPALERAGIDAEPAVWSSHDVLWETFDGVVIRSCWDYHRRIEEFRAWLERLDAGRIPVWNAPAFLLWNSHKSYLMDLARRGIATIPTTVIPRVGAPEIESVAHAEGWTEFVLKPAISASGFETHVLHAPLDDKSRALIQRVASLGDVLVQPFAPEVSRDGEYSFIFIDGEFSHAAIKRAASGEFRVQTEHGGSVEPVIAPPLLVEQAARALAALSSIPLYARVDGIARGDAFLLMELELIEPNLFFDVDAGSAQRFAEALARRLTDA